MNKDPIERAKRRFREVQEIMANAAQVRQEYYDLEAFLNQAYKLFPDAFDEWPLPGTLGTQPQATPVASSAPTSATLTPENEKKPKRRRTSDFAEWVLKVHGALHIREIMRRMREEGWSGNDDDTIAEKTLFNIMAARKDRFRNTGKNVWELVVKKS